MKDRIALSFFCSLLIIVLTACDNRDSSKENKPAQVTQTTQTSQITPTELLQQGEKLFQQKHLGKNKMIGCVLCHSIKKGEVIIGPSLAGLSLRAGHIVAGQTAKQYIKTSIINPDAHIVDGFLPSTMLSGYKEALSENELNALIAYLLQL